MSSGEIQLVLSWSEERIKAELLSAEQPPWQILKGHPDFRMGWVLHFLSRRKAISSADLLAIYRDGTLRKDYSIRLALAACNDLPVSALQALLPGLRWGDLLQMLRQPRLGSVVKHHIEGYLQGIFVTLTLGEKIAFTRKATRVLIAFLRLQQEPAVLQALLDNPYFGHEDALFLANNPSLPGVALGLLCQNGKWSCSREIRLALLHNRRLASSQVVELSRNLSRHECQTLLQMPGLPVFVRRVLERRLQGFGHAGRT